MRLFTKEELLSRAGRLQERLRSAGVAVAILTANSDLYYFTGSVQRGLLVIPAAGEPIYFVRKYLARAQRESPLMVVPFDGAALTARLAEAGAVIGFAADAMTVSEYEFLKGKLFPPGATLKDFSLSLALTKMVKSPVEQSLIEKAAAINRAVHAQIGALYRPGMRDIDMQVALESYARRELGHQGSFWLRGANMEAALSLVVTGTTALEPTYTDFPIGGKGLSPAVAQGASGEVIERSFVVDLIGTRHGYNADSTRTYFVGAPEERIGTMYEELRGFLGRVVSFITPGITGEEAWNYATALVAEHAWKDQFMGLDAKVRFLGHGIGTEVNQLPVIAAKQAIPFENGMTVAIEPKIFVPGWGIVGIENTYLMEGGMLRSLTGGTEALDEVIIG
ncbi:MAG TPA: M24 family metallopeptidase [bacterium]|nr:M24 family metallopeptidase [bacterium]